jgi:hypothetical protein
MRYECIPLCVALFTATARAQAVTPPNDQFVGPDRNAIGLWAGPSGRFRFDVDGTFRATPTDASLPRQGGWTTLVIPTPKFALLPKTPILCINWRTKREPSGTETVTICRSYTIGVDGTFYWGVETLHRVGP